MKNQTLKKLLIVSLVAVASFGLTFSLARRDNRATADTNNIQQVQLRANGADPDTLTLKVGETAQFNSADGKSHSLSGGIGGEDHDHKGSYSSGEFKADEAWKATFSEKGTYTLHDHLNPKISVLLIVYEPNKK